MISLLKQLKRLNLKMAPISLNLQSNENLKVNFLNFLKITEMFLKHVNACQKKHDVNFFIILKINCKVFLGNEIQKAKKNKEKVNAKKHYFDFLSGSWSDKQVRAFTKVKIVFQNFI